MMINLKNTYIENDKGELRDLYVLECAKQGFNAYCGATINQSSFGFLYVTQSNKGECVMGCVSSCVANHKQITLADLKPRVKVEYVKCEFNHAWEAVKAFEEYESNKSQQLALYINNGGCGGKEIVNRINGALVNYNDLFKKVEREITWKDEAKEFFVGHKGSDFEKYIDFNNTNGDTVMQSDFIKLCHLVASMTNNDK